MDKIINRKLNITKVLLLIYVIILTWIILFKMQFDLEHLPYIRGINLIPFGESVIVNGKIYLSEIINNLIVFIPVGVYIGMIKKENKFLPKLIPIFFLTLFYEIMQFILHIGATDITDLIMNTLGGAIGIVIINGIYKLFKNKERTDKVLNVLACICTIGILSLVSILIIMNTTNNDISYNYELNLPELEKLRNITLEQNEDSKIISDNEEMKEIWNTLNGGDRRITNEQSIQDAPVNVNDKIEVDFNFKETGASTIFVYEKKSMYYIEQPYNGIYVISEDEYNLIEEYVR